MSAKIQEIITTKSEHETPPSSVDPGNPSDTTKDEHSYNIPKVTSSTLKTPKKSPAAATRTATKKPTTVAKKSNSGIPRLKSGTNTNLTKPKSGGTYRHPTSATTSTVNKNTLEVQFMNNKKRLLQLHADLVEKQRPLLEMHRALQRTKKQLEELGKKVVLEDLKVVALKSEEKSSVDGDGSGETPAIEAAIALKSSFDDVLDSCKKACQKCFGKSYDVVRILESVSRSEVELSEFETDIEQLKHEKEELERTIEETVAESEKKIEEAINNWQKIAKSRNISDEITTKIGDLEEKIKQQQKIIQDAEENAHSLNRRLEDKKASYERAISEMQDRINKLEEELKKERKNAADNLMKSRNLRGKLSDLEARTKEAEEKCNEAVTKLRQVQEQMRKKEVQWVKEKDDFKKNEALLQQKFTERQSQFDARLKEMEEAQKSNDKQQHNFFRTMETQLEIKDQELVMLEKERDILSDRSRGMEEQIEHLRKQIDEKDREIVDLNARKKTVPAIEYRTDPGQWAELMEYKNKVEDAQLVLKQQTEQMLKMQSSLKAHAQLAVALKLEKDNAIKYSNKLRDILQEARDELEQKDKTIYKIHEKLVLREAACDKLRAEIKDLETCSELTGRAKNRCQICMSTLNTTGKMMDPYVDTNEVGKMSNCNPQYDSLIGMSVKKVDNLRARLDNLKKMKLPGKKRLSKINYSWSNQSCEAHPVTDQLNRQIELKGKLYQILQKHADQSCEDFINLLKMTVSTSGKSTQGFDELKPSNDEHFSPRRYTSNIKITKSYSTISQYINNMPINEIYNESVILENEAGERELGRF